MSESATPETSKPEVSSPTQQAADEWHAPVPVKLKKPWLAALLAWLWPGAGHLYQGRYAKGILFMVCVLSTYFFGFALGDGRVVYASFKSPDIRYAYLCQVGVGLPALPALEQSRRVKKQQPPLFNSRLMMPPDAVDPNSHDELAQWHTELNGYFELASLYTMVAGLLNMLAIYDAFAGPVFPLPEEKQNKPPPKDGDTGGSKTEPKPVPT